ncbi:MAG: F-type H+-transporting ATPase subunit gamma, partial [Parcubacteria group bacterium Gr01-1014_66]
FRYEYVVEPSPEAVLETLTEELIRMQVHHAILEANASEHSARMVAMKNASDSAEELIGTLTRAFNKARQQAITQELTEITAGKEALEG